MTTLMIVKIALIVTGILFVVLDFLAYAKQRLTENIGLGWGLFSMLLMITGVVLDPDEADGDVIYLLIFLLGLFLLFVVFAICKSVSVLIMKNRELAMQVSLLNQENERILHELGILKDKDDKSPREAENT
ncbi:MAG: hypothetical protein K1W19_10095 [Lachnospiraceae bacterium]|jgi:hypothetical protein|nr:hypothetical protein [Lachnospiraceae bacterium]MCI8826694.1 hypothetical protein [Lachnospiraceae bacterium]MCI9371039.1 hypothetical protein [Lachnospiraceae bacterium]MDE7307857.1 hypothetical protein [Lachnospiraceae bacterium]